MNGWPTVRGGFWASGSAQASPTAKSSDPQRYVPTFKQDDQPGSLIASASDEFDQAKLSPQWSWVRPPDPATYRMTGSAFEWDRQAEDLYVDIKSSSVLTEAAPPGDCVVEVKVAVSVPPSGSGFNYSQAGLIIYRDDDNYIKLVPIPINEARQTEFAKEVGPVGPGYPRCGNTVVGPPGDWTWPRIARRQQGAEEAYTAYTSNDGVNWVRGGTWPHRLTTFGRIELVSQSGAGFTADFDYVRVYSLP